MDNNFKERFLDLFISVPVLVLLTPVLVIIAVIIRITLGRPVFFVQLRPGLNSTPFKLYKFRTMTNGRDSGGRLLPDRQRLTTLGRILRSSSLDELPELFNVIKGDMRVVGPRPLLMKYLDRYTPEQKRRHSVKPGLTGWAQVNGRNAITWNEKLDLDVWYVDHHNIMLDIKIILQTVKVVISQQGIYHDGEATMREFFPTDNA